MFELESSVASWRQQMQRSGIKSVSTLDELESHLRDDFEAQFHSGLPPQEAFDIAAWNIGPALDLQTEFGKVQRNQNSTRVALTYLAIIGCLQYLAFTREMQPNLYAYQCWECLTTLLLTSLTSYIAWKLMRYGFELATRPTAQILICCLTGIIGVAYVSDLTNSFFDSTFPDKAHMLALIWWLFVPLHVLNLFVLDQYRSRPRGAICLTSKPTSPTGANKCNAPE